MQNNSFCTHVSCVHYGGYRPHCYLVQSSLIYTRIIHTAVRSGSDFFYISGMYEVHRFLRCILTYRMYYGDCMGTSILAPGRRMVDVHTTNTAVRGELLLLSWNCRETF